MRAATSEWLAELGGFTGLRSRRFLADRFVEGICPHCQFEVNHPLSGYIYYAKCSVKDARGDQCDGCARTLDAIELLKPRCIINKAHNVVPRTSSHMYFKLDAVQPRWEVWAKKSWKEGKWSPNAVINADGEIIDARAKGGLRPTPVTRDLTWGVPVPIKEGGDQSMKGKVLCE